MCWLPFYCVRTWYYFGHNTTVLPFLSIFESYAFIEYFDSLVRKEIRLHMVQNQMHMKDMLGPYLTNIEYLPTQN